MLASIPYKIALSDVIVHSGLDFPACKTFVSLGKRKYNPPTKKRQKEAFLSTGDREGEL